MSETDMAISIQSDVSSGRMANGMSTDNTVMTALRNIRALGSNGLAYGETTNLSDAGFTSLEMVQVMLAIEAAFDIMIPQDMVTPENFTSAASITSMVETLTSVD